jgi:glucose-6-phosphate 1-epimerase
MIDLEQLEEKYSIEGEVGFSQMEGDLVFMTVSNKFADADICLYGAHITNFKPHKTIEVLWMSPESKFVEGSPIRGGIPVCFPWFGPHKSDSSKPQHGFGRLMYWDVLETASTKTGETLVRLQLYSSPETKAYWDYDFCAELTIVVGKMLTASLKVINTSSTDFEYTCALHSYFNLSSIEEIKIEGLQNTRYNNQLDGGDFVQEEEILEIHKAETRHYYNTETDCFINDPLFSRRIKVAKSGSKITTVWNPWEETCAKIDDLPDEAFHTFVCIEAVNAFSNAIKLTPGESHETTAIIGLDE